MELNLEKYKRDLKRLFIVHVCQILLTVLALVPFLTNVLKVISVFVLLGIVLVLFDLSKEMNNKRFFKAAIFMLIAEGIHIVDQFGNGSIISLMKSIFLILSLYQECNGHAEVLAEFNGALSKRWKDYFGIYLWVTIGVNMILSAFIIALSGLFFQYAVLTLVVTLIASVGYALVLEVLYLFTIKSTLKMFI